jgi:hypothetical protein
VGDDASTAHTTIRANAASLPAIARSTIDHCASPSGATLPIVLYKWPAGRCSLRCDGASPDGPVVVIRVLHEAGFSAPPEVMTERSTAPMGPSGTAIQKFAQDLSASLGRLLQKEMTRAIVRA